MSIPSPKLSNKEAHDGSGGQTLIHADHLSLRYGETEVFTDLSFSIQAGSFTSIVGPNGAGKTQLMRTMLGFVEPSQGYIKRNFSISDIGYVPQKIHVDPTFPITVKEFLTTYLNPQKVWGRTKLPTLDKVVDISHLLPKMMGQLSGGQLQRVLLAAALSTEPKVLFLDEFSAGIDPRGQSELYSYLRTVHEQQRMSIIMISHDIDMTAEYADMALCLNKCMICHGSPKQVFTSDTFKEMYGLPLTLLSHDKHDDDGHSHNHI